MLIYWTKISTPQEKQNLLHASNGGWSKNKHREM